MNLYQKQSDTLIPAIINILHSTSNQSSPVTDEPTHLLYLTSNSSYHPQLLPSFHVLFRLPLVLTPTHYHLFLTHDCTISISVATVSEFISTSISHVTLSENLTQPCISLTISISAHNNASSYSLLAGQVSLPCKIKIND